MTTPHVLMIGLAAAEVDFDKYEDLTPEKLTAAGKQVERDLREAGYVPFTCLITDGDAGVEQAVRAMRRSHPDVVVIGAGVRSDPDRLRLFEQLVNACRAELPDTPVAFNTRPWDTLEAVRRWVVPAEKD